MCQNPKILNLPSEMMKKSRKSSKLGSRKNKQMFDMFAKKITKKTGSRFSFHHPIATQHCYKCTQMAFPCTQASSRHTWIPLWTVFAFQRRPLRHTKNSSLQTALFWCFYNEPCLCVNSISECTEQVFSVSWSYQTVWKCHRAQVCVFVHVEPAASSDLWACLRENHNNVCFLQWCNVMKNIYPHYGLE